MIVEFHSDETAAVRHPLAIDDSSLGRFFVERSDRNLLTRPPVALGEYAGTMSADIIRVGPFYFVRSREFRIREANHHND